MGIEPKTSWSSLECCTDCTSQVCVGQEISEHDFIKALMIQTDNHIVKHWHDDQEVLDSILTGAIFWLNLFCSSSYEPLLATLSTLYNLGKTQMCRTFSPKHWIVFEYLTTIQKIKFWKFINLWAIETRSRLKLVAFQNESILIGSLQKTIKSL